MVDAIPFGVLALVLGAYGLVMLRRRARLHAVAAELEVATQAPATT